MEEKKNSLAYLIKMSYRQMENQNINFTPCRVRVSSKMLQRHYEEISYSGESKTDGNDRPTTVDDEIFSLIRKHNSQPGTYGASRNVVVRIKVSNKLFNRLYKADLLVNLEDTIINGVEECESVMRDEYWSI